MSSYNTFWITTTANNEGIKVHTRADFTLRLDDLYVNSNNMLLVEFVSPFSKTAYLRTSIDDAKYLTITQINNKETHEN